MPAKIRVVKGPLPTDEEGRTIQAGTTWAPVVSTDMKRYSATHVNGARVPWSNARLSAQQRIVAKADEVLDKNRRLFRDLA